MNCIIIRIFFCVFIATSTSSICNAQPLSVNYKVASLSDKLEDTLRSQFAAKKIKWPLKAMYLRSFKYDKQIEVWVKDDLSQPYKLFKTYKVCMQSGRMGPKRMEGDYQVPEGFYHINEFNPNSNYHLALGINYPNASDRILSDAAKPGTAIYIHGNCVSVGCIPVTDTYIEEIYLLAGKAKNAGQEFIPVHVFPVRYNVPKSAEYLAEACKINPSLTAFSATLKEVFDFFEEKKQLPIILVNQRGEYVFN
jgi:murein L,D-transpeptidase YafK